MRARHREIRSSNQSNESAALVYISGLGFPLYSSLFVIYSRIIFQQTSTNIPGNILEYLPPPKPQTISRVCLVQRYGGRVPTWRAGRSFVVDIAYMGRFFLFIRTIVQRGSAVKMSNRPSAGVGSSPRRASHPQNLAKVKVYSQNLQYYCVFFFWHTDLPPRTLNIPGNIPAYFF